MDTSCYAGMSEMSLSNGKGKYLRLPYMIGHSKKSAFSYVRDRVARKNLGWKEKLLTQAGEEVLFDSVLQVIPTYVMSLYLLPKTLVDDVTSIIRQFSWHNRGKERTICYVK